MTKKLLSKSLVTAFTVFAVYTATAQTPVTNFTMSATTAVHEDNESLWGVSQGTLNNDDTTAASSNQERTLIGNSNSYSNGGVTIFIDLGSVRSDITVLNLYAYAERLERSNGLEIYVSATAFPTGEYWDGTDDNMGGNDLTPLHFDINAAVNTKEDIDMTDADPFQYIAIRQPAATFLQLVEIDIFDSTPPPVTIDDYTVTYTTADNGTDWSLPTILNDGNKNNRTLIGDGATAGATIYIDLQKDYTNVALLKLYGANRTDNATRGGNLEIYTHSEAEGAFATGDFWDADGEEALLTGVNCVIGTGSETAIPDGTGAIRYIAIRQPAAIWLQVAEVEIILGEEPSLSVTAQQLDNVSIYTANRQTLNIKGIKEGATAISMYNIIGKQVLNARFNANGNNSIALPSALKTGVYFVKVKNIAGSINKKIIVQ